MIGYKQLIFVKPYTNVFGTVRPVGYKTIAKDDYAAHLISLGVAHLFEDFDLQEDAKRQMDDHFIKRDNALIETPKRTWLQKILSIFKI